MALGEQRVNASTYHSGGIAPGRRRAWLLPAALSVVMVAANLHSHLLFHTLAELFAVLVAVIAGVVAWQSHVFSRNGFLLYLGCGYIWIGGLDLVHLVTYRGADFLVATESDDTTLQIWIGARFLEALLILSAPLFLRRHIEPYPALLGTGVVAAVLLALVLAGQFPSMYVDGSGLTPVKVGSEYAIIALLGVAGLVLWRSRERMDPELLRLLLFSVGATAAAEFLFTRYSDFGELPTILGHLLKLLSYWFIYTAVVRTTLTQPFRALARGASTYEAVPDPAVVVDRNGLIHQINRAARRFIGEHAGYLGSHIHALLHPGDEPPERCPVCALIGRGLPVEGLEVHFADRDLWHLVSLARVDHGGDAHAMVHVSRDITQRKLAERALQESHERLVSILDSVGEGIFGLDAEGVCLFVNPAFERITGWSAAEAIGREMHSLLHHTRPDGSDHPSAECPIVGTVSSGIPCHIADDIFWRKDGSSFPADFNSAPLRDREARVTGAVVVFRDITERREAEHELQLHRENLEQLVAGRTAELQAANRELEAFSYSVSHDLRGPLRAINGFSQALVEDCAEQLDDTARRYLERITDASSHMSQLIDGLLTLSRIMRRELEYETVDLSRLATEIAHRKQATEPERPVRFEIAPGLTAECDGTLIRLLLENLLDNAWKFTARVSEPVIEFGCIVGEGGDATFYVKDNGVGFDMRYTNKLFEPFQRLHTADDFEGTGIGLATVRRIIGRHGGRVWAEGEVDRHATIYFALPKR